MARLRMDGVSSDALVPTPPAGKATIFYNSTDRVYKVKLDDGSVAPIGAGGGGAVDSVNGQTGVVVLTKADLGLENVDNTSDANKPISTATASALAAKYDSSNPAGYVDAAGASAAAPVQSVAGQTGAVTLAKADVGLSNVDNTSDADKPISTATQTALNAQELRISTAEGEIDALQVDVSALQAGQTDLGSRVFTLEGEVVGLDSAVTGLDTRVTAVEGSVSTLQSDVSSMQTEIATIESELVNVNSAIASKYDASNPANYVDAAGAASAAPVQSVAGKIGDVTIDLSTDVAGALPVSLGGSGRTDFPAMQLLFGAPDALSIDRSEFLTYDASIGLLINQGGQMQTRSLEQNPTDPSAVVIYDKVEVTGDDGTGPAYSRLKRDYIEARKVLPTKELSASAGFDGVDSWLGVSETTNEGNNISMAKIFPNKAQLFTVDVGAGTGPQPILPVESYDLTTKAYVDSGIGTLGDRVTTVEGEVVGLDGAVAGLQTQVADLAGVVQGNFDLQQSDIDGLRSDVDAISSDLNNLDVYAQDIRSDVDDLTVYAQDIRSDLDLFVAPSGASRPASPVVGQIFFDTVLGKPIFYSGSAWVDAAGTVV